MSTFQVGEIAIIQNMVGEAVFLNGCECLITGPLATYSWISGDRFETGKTLGYRVQIADDEHPIIVLPSELRKKPPPTEYTGELRIMRLFDRPPVTSPIDAEVLTA